MYRTYGHYYCFASTVFRSPSPPRVANRQPPTAARQAAMKRLEGIVHPLVAADRDAFLQQVCARAAHAGTRQRTTSTGTTTSVHMHAWAVASPHALITSPWFEWVEWL